jgi:hypothetical protein
MANEKRLIDANVVLAKQFTAGLSDASGNYYGHADVVFVDDIENAPTVDAVEVVHGEWEKQQGIYSCSICGKACPYDVQADIIQYWPCNYCPSCGAKMDGE